MNNAQSVSRSIKLSPKQKIELAIGTLDALKSVEAVVKSKFDSRSAKLNEISKYLFSIGGKRIRPILTLLTAQSLGMESPSNAVIDVAAGIELIHMATLLHDDIIDKSPLRRHETSPWIKFGTGDTLLCGDFLLTRAFALCARLDAYIINRTEVACAELTEGEVDELPLSIKDFTIEQSLEISRKKTGSLFRLSCETAAHLCGQSEQIKDLFSRCGESLGIAFQVLDDILDVTSSEDLLGKKAGIDIIEQKPSVVNVLWLKTDSSKAKEILKKTSIVSEQESIDAIKELRTSLVINQAKAIASTKANDALGYLEEIHTTIPLQEKPRQALKGLAQYILDRME